MLDENLPAFFIRPSDDPLQSTIFLSQGGRDPLPEYTLRRPDPATPAAKNCYAVALYDSHNPDVLYAEVLVQPEWSQPTLSQAEIRANNGLTPPPVPIVPSSFAVQLYNPDQQVVVRQVAGSWNSSAYWEFEMPQHTFRVPSASSLDRAQSDPAASALTPKAAFKWKRDGKLSRDLACFLVGRSADGKKSREPDITVAMFKRGKELTLYEPNLHRVDVEDTKGLEVVILLGVTVIRDIFFEASREMFNISSPSASGARKPSAPPPVAAYAPSPPFASGALPPPSPTAPDPMAQWQLDQETARLRAQLDADAKERERRDRHEQKRIKKMLEAEEKERRRRDTDVAKETERLRRQYGVEPVRDDFAPRPAVHFSPSLPPRALAGAQGPSMPPRPNAAYGGGNYPPPPQPQPQDRAQSRMSLYNHARPVANLPEYFAAPHARPAPVRRPASTTGARSSVSLVPRAAFLAF